MCSAGSTLSTPVRLFQLAIALLLQPLRWLLVENVPVSATAGRSHPSASARSPLHLSSTIVLP